MAAELHHPPTAEEAYTLSKAEGRLNAALPVLKQVASRLEEFSDYIDYTITAGLTDDAKQAIEEIHGEDSNQ